MNIGDAVIARVGKLMLDGDPIPSTNLACKWNDGIGVVLKFSEANSGSNRIWVKVLCPHGVGWCFDNELVIVQKNQEEKL